MFKKNRNKPAAQPHNENENNNLPKKQQQQNTKNNTGAATEIKGTQLVFHCQLAHGSPTAFVTGFSNVKELYTKIADEFEIPVSEILFCTLNTYKIDMKQLLAGQIGLEDFIFAHRKGRPKEIELTKDENALGLTITDNGAGYAFIKRIKEGSVIDRVQHIQVGDHIEKLNGVNMVGKRHHEVARLLKEIPLDSTFTIRLIEPMKSGFSHIGVKSQNGRNTGKMGTGKETIRFKANGNVEIQEENDVMNVAIEKINSILENFLGINDAELATQIWDQSEGKKNSMEFADAVDHSDLEEFGFTDDLIIELWGAITDARDGRLK